MRVKTPMQKLINGKPSEFAKRIGCPKSTANHYSNGTRTPPPWVYGLIKEKIKRDNKVTIDKHKLRYYNGKSGLQLG